MRRGTSRRVWRAIQDGSGHHLLFMVLAATKMACGGSPNQPSGGGGGTGGPTITITSSGVSPQSLTITRGTQVTFVNNDSRVHEMNSDPHPTHGDCPEIDVIGLLNPGQSRQTGNFNAARRCGFHDHRQPTNDGLTGAIVVQ